MSGNQPFRNRALNPDSLTWDENIYINYCVKMQFYL